MAWPTLTLRERREQARGDYEAHVPNADTAIPNSPDAALTEAQAALTHDNDLHLDWVAEMMMPDTAKGEFADRWGNIWLPDGRKGATFSQGSITVTGTVGAIVPSGAELSVSVRDSDGIDTIVQYEVTLGATLTDTTAVVPIAALTPGTIGNLDEGADLAFIDVPAGIDGVAVVAPPGLAGGADQEIDQDLIERYVARIQEPPHGGAKHDYEAWALELAGVTRAWPSSEMGIGTMTVRVMLDDVRAANDGLPEQEDLDLVMAHMDNVRPATVADLFVVAPIRQDEQITVSLLAVDTPETRANIIVEVREMLRARAAPGKTISASWVREAVSAAIGEDEHDLTIDNLVPASPGHMIFIDVVFD